MIQKNSVFEWATHGLQVCGIHNCNIVKWYVRGVYKYIPVYILLVARLSSLH